MASHTTQRRELLSQSWESLSKAIDNPYAFIYNIKSKQFESAGWKAWSVTLITKNVSSSMEHLVYGIEELVERTFRLKYEIDFSQEQQKQLPRVVYAISNKIPMDYANLKQRMAQLYRVMIPETGESPIEEDFHIIDSSSSEGEGARVSPNTFLHEFSFKDHELKQVKYERSLRSSAVYLHDYFHGKKFDLSIDVVDIRTGLQKMKAALDERTHVRKRYRNFIDALRKCLQTLDYRTQLHLITKKNYPEEIQLLHSILLERFIGNSMDDHCQEIVEASMHYNGEFYKLSWEEQFQLIANMPKELQENKAAAAVASFCSYMNVFFDPHRHTNVPYVNFRFDLNQKTRSNLRLGTPTSDATVISEFKGFLDAKKVINDTHLFINLQNKVKKRGGNEKGRCDALEALSREYKATFFLVTFSHDSAFYKQICFFELIDNAEEFKGIFLKQLESLENFFFSENLKVFDLHEMILDILKDVHSAVFGSKERLSIQERQAFIDIAYALITIKLLGQTGANTYNISCRHAIDRGGKSSSVLFYIAGMLNNQHDEDDFKRRHAIVTHAPAMLVKKRAMLKNRRERLIQALSYLEKNQVAFQLLRPYYTVSAPF